MWQSDVTQFPVRAGSRIGVHSSEFNIAAWDLPRANVDEIRLGSLTKPCAVVVVVCGGGVGRCIVAVLTKHTQESRHIVSE